MTAPGLFIRTSGLAYAAAPTLVLLHGFTDSGACWGDAVARWDGRYRIVAPDALGHGESPRFTEADLAGDAGALAYAATVAVIERVVGDAGPVVLVGHSMGGAMATAVTARRPDLVRGAVLEDPAWLSDEVIARRAEGAGSWLADNDRWHADPAAELAAGRLANPAWPESELPAWAEAKLLVDRGLLARGGAMDAEPWQALVAAIRRPVLVVTGTDGVIIGSPRPDIEAIGNAAVTLAVIEGAGHCVRRDRGEAFHALVDPWIVARFADVRTA